MVKKMILSRTWGCIICYYSSSFCIYNVVAHMKEKHAMASGQKQSQDVIPQPDEDCGFKRRCSVGHCSGFGCLSMTHTSFTLNSTATTLGSLSRLLCSGTNKLTILIQLGSFSAMKNFLHAG